VKVPVGRRARPRTVLGLLVLAVVSFVILGSSVGAARVGPVSAGAMILRRVGFSGIKPWWGEADEAILFAIRLPRVVLAAIVGATLAASGAAFQGLFRNPMADPFVLGTSPGAALGATIAIVLRLNVTYMGISSVPLFAFAGALLTSIAVYAMSRMRGAAPREVLLLTGIAFGSLLSSVTSLLMVLSSSDLSHVFFWIMGGLSGATWSRVTMVLPYSLLGLALIMASARELNLMLLGEEDAFHLGVDVERTKTRILAAASLACAAAVAASGVVGFVGLMVPHTVRLLTGPDHRVFMPSALLAGAAILLLADIISRVVLAPQEIPLGIVTAILGVPFFLFLLRRKEAGD